MLKKIFLAALITLSFSFFSTNTAGQTPAPTSEDVKTRFNKPETIDLMLQTGRIPLAQRNSRIDLILKDQAGSKTPRSDFTFCLGLAYFGNYKAQACVGKAYESGLGIVEDLSEAYTWYAVALDNRIDDSAAQQRLESDKNRIELKLRSSYPAPSDDELEEMLRSQKNRITQYQEEVKKIKK